MNLERAIYKSHPLSQFVNRKCAILTASRRILLLRARTLLKVWLESPREGHSCFQQWRTILEEDCHLPFPKQYLRPSMLI